MSIQTPEVTPEQIRETRALLRWRQEDLAAYMGVAKMTITRWEAGSPVARYIRTALHELYADARETRRLELELERELGIRFSPFTPTDSRRIWLQAHERYALLSDPGGFQKIAESFGAVRTTEPGNVSALTVHSRTEQRELVTA